jgi:hypothetical protein
MADKRAQERFGHYYVLVISLIMLASYVAEPPSAWWRIILYLVLPLTLTAFSAWQLLVERRC